MKIELPQVGESVAEGVIGKWLKQVGDRVEKYDPLVEVVTDKVNMEMPSPVSGVLTSIHATEGQTVPMGSVIAEIEVEGEREAGSAAQALTGAAASAAPGPADRIGTLLEDAAPVGPTGSGGPISLGIGTDASSPARRSSPAVQRLAAEHGVDLSLVDGTGMSGRVTRKDVQTYIESAEARKSPAAVQGRPALAVERGPDEERVPLTPVRRIIAENMVRSASEIPQAWTMMEADVTGLDKLRERAGAGFQVREGAKLTYLPFVLKAVAESLKANPRVNSSWGGDSIVLKRRVNLGIAVATASGLMVPVVHDADGLGIAALARAVEDLADRARHGRLTLVDVQGGTFTVNNTGALGPVIRKPLVKPGEAAIMTTEAVVKRPVVVNDAIAIRSIMNLCLTFDHRIIDGAEAGAFLADVKLRLEAVAPDDEF